jgi:hypothetical protein
MSVFETLESYPEFWVFFLGNFFGTLFSWLVANFQYLIIAKYDLFRQYKLQPVRGFQPILTIRKTRFKMFFFSRGRFLSLCIFFGEKDATVCEHLMEGSVVKCNL